MSVCVVSECVYNECVNSSSCWHCRGERERESELPCIKPHSEVENSFSVLAKRRG